MLKRKIYTILLCLPLIGIWSCRRQQQAIPYVFVDLYLNIDNPSNFLLTSPGGWDYKNGGSKGLIVYRKQEDQFVVFDRHCTYNADNACGAASVDSTNIQISCDCDGSVYQLHDGSVIQGPATLPLHQYRSDFNGSVLHIYN